MKKKLHLFGLIFIVFILGSCLGTTRHYITIKTIDVDTELPVSGITVLVGNIEHSSSASGVRVLQTNAEGVAKITYYSARKDAIRITIQPKNGYHTIGKAEFNYLEYKRVINLDIDVQK